MTTASLATPTNSVDVRDWQVRDTLQQENEKLRRRVELQAEQLSAMRAHLGIIRQHTVTFILDQMDTLHMQRDTEVWRQQTEATRVPVSHGRSAPLTGRHPDLVVVVVVGALCAPSLSVSVFCDADYFLIDMAAGWIERLQICAQNKKVTFCRRRYSAVYNCPWTNPVRMKKNITFRSHRGRAVVTFRISFWQDFFPTKISSWKILFSFRLAQTKVVDHTCDLCVREANSRRGSRINW